MSNELGVWSIAKLAAVMLVAALNAGGVAQAADRTVGGLKAFSPQPVERALKPGLTVRYLSPKIRFLDELVRFVKSRPGTPGQNIAALDFADKGPGAYVMGTREVEMVAAIIDGLIKFDQPGSYQFVMVANDLVQLNIGGQTIIEKDWDGMPSQLGEPVTVAIDQAGWYQLHVKYHQRKGTAALELLWTGPGLAGAFTVVPPQAFAHIAE